MTVDVVNYLLLIINHLFFFQSVVIPVFNGAQWLDKALGSILHQSFQGILEVSIFNDASTVSTGLTY